MKKRILSIVLTLCMIMAIMPQAAVAADADWENKIWIGNTPVNKSTNMTDNTWVFFPGYNILVLSDGFVRTTTSNLTDSKDKAVIRIESLKNVTIQLQGNATIGVPSIEYLPPEAANGISTYGIYAPNTNLAIEGTGTLNVNSNANAIWCKDLRVEGPTLNCCAYRTAIKVVGTGYIDTEENGNMLVKSGAKVTARTVNGSGVYPLGFKKLNGVYTSYGVNYKENGGAAILVSGAFTVEDSTVTGENTCNKLPDFPDNLDSIYMGCFDRSRFCSAIFSRGIMRVSGAGASVSGRLTNKETYFGDEYDDKYCTKLGAVVAEKMIVEQGGTIEGFITNAGNPKYAQGLKSFVQASATPALEPVKISLTGEGIFRNGLSDGTVTTESPNYVDDGPYDIVEYTDSRDLYPSYREIIVSKSTTLYLEKDSSISYSWSFQKDFNIYHNIDSRTDPVLIDLKNLADNNTFVDNVKVLSGDWTIIPPCDNEVDYYVESGSLTIRPQDGMEYTGGSAHIQVGTTLNIDGDGIAKNWDVSAYNGKNSLGGTLRFVSGTVENASASIGISVCIIGGNINFNPIPMMQNVKNGDGTKLYKDVYFMGPKADELVLINTGEGTITPESSYYYPIGYDKALVVWTVNDLPIKYVTVAPQDKESYNLIPGGAIENLGNEYHSLVTAERYREFVPNSNYKFFRNPDESVTMNAAGVINTYENRLDSVFYGPYLIGSTTDLGSSFRAEWSYQNDNGEKVVVGGNSLTCTIDDLSDIVNYRTYTCTVYEKAANGSEKAIGSYNANVYVMRWEQPDTIYAGIGKEITFTANPSAETKWAADLLSTLKWQVNKGTGWEDIPSSNTDSYTVTITEENAAYKYRRVLDGFIIGAYDKGQYNIYMNFASPELSPTFAPEITAQPQGLTIHEKDTTEHAVSVTAENAVSYQWQKKAGGVFADIEGQTSSTLKVGPQDAGTYRCVVKNAYGETVSKEAIVKMQPAPSCDTLSPANVTLGSKAEFGVGINDAPGDSGISVKWQYSADNGATWVDVISIDDSNNISMNVLEIVFSQIYSDGTVIRRTEIRSSSMTINKTTADMDGWKVRCVLTDAFGVYYSNTVELNINMPDYTVTFNTDGGTEIASKTTVKWTDKVLDGITAPTKDGWKFIGWKYGDVTVTPQTTYKELAADGTVSSIELKAQWEDITAPTGKISIGENSWEAFLNKITFGLFFKDTKTVTITASDNSADAMTISYLLSNKALTANELSAKEFTGYTGGFDIKPNNEWIIYVKLTDKAGNVTYLSSDGIVLDNVAPVISGVENGKTYCGAQTVTVDEKYIDSVTVNGKKVSLNNNQFNLSVGTQKIVATDKAGNVSAEITVTVNDGHTDENKDHKCDYCGEETTTCKDDDKNHLCDICSATLSEHTGGKATCTEKAVCDYCGKEYGEPKGHSYKETVVQPTEFSLGGTQHTCHNCGDQYWDNFTKKDTSYKVEVPGGITLDNYFTISEKPEISVNGESTNPVVSVFLQDPLGILKRMEDDGIKLYKITEGAEQVIVPSSDKKIVFRSNAPFKEFDQVMLNGLVLDKKYYSVKEGSTIVTLNADFVNKIPTGMHLFGIISTDGVAITTFTVDDKATADNDTNSAQTGDNSHMAFWIALLFVSGALLTVTVINCVNTESKRRKRHE